jgi:hypothetical protein
MVGNTCTQVKVRNTCTQVKVKNTFTHVKVRNICTKVKAKNTYNSHPVAIYFLSSILYGLSHRNR